MKKRAVIRVLSSFRDRSDIFQEALRKSKNITSDPFQVLRMSQDDLKKLGEIENCIKFISETIEKIR